MAPQSLKDASDGALVVAIGRWREDALAEAYRRHAGAVYSLARRVTADTVLAEEVVRRCSCACGTARTSSRSGPRFPRSYLLAQCPGRSVDLLRAVSSRRRREETDARQSDNRGYDLEPARVVPIEESSLRSIGIRS